MTQIYPLFICHTCGTQAQRDNNKITPYAEYHKGICGICGGFKAVTSPDNFGRPEFKHLK